MVLSFDSCGSCPSCSTGKPFGCYNFNPLNLKNVGFQPGRLDGSTSFTDANGEPVGSHFFGQSSFASHSVVASHSAVKVDKDLTLEALGPLGCGVQTGAGAILNTLDVQPGTSVVILGAGSLGLSAVMAAKLAGAGTIIAVDKHQSRLDLAATYGATHGISGSLDEIGAQISPDHRPWSRLRVRHHGQRCAGSSRVRVVDLRGHRWAWPVSAARR